MPSKPRGDLDHLFDGMRSNEADLSRRIVSYVREGCEIIVLGLVGKLIVAVTGRQLADPVDSDDELPPQNKPEYTPTEAEIAASKSAIDHKLLEQLQRGERIARSRLNRRTKAKA